MTGRSRARYPQVDPGAAGIMSRAVVCVSADESVDGAAARVRRRQTRFVAVSSPAAVGGVPAAILKRAQALGLGSMKVADIAWRELPVVGSRRGEITVRRLLIEGAPAVLVGEGQRVAGVVEPPSTGMLPFPFSLRSRIERQIPQAAGDLLRETGAVGDRMGTPVFAVGGFVRDLLLGRPTPDLDLVVQGNGLAFARRLARRLQGRLSVYRAFGTATIEGVPIGRIDVATARRERYAMPGALPTVTTRASIVEDLRRRDFTVNAMAVSLSAHTFGDLLDPSGGYRDVRRRRVRVLHPLSFIEDPTRIFRALRYAVRLGFSLDRETRRLLAIATRMGLYPALSGQRLLAEIDLMATEAEPHRILAGLGRAGALRLFDSSCRFSQSAAARLSDLGDLLRTSGRFPAELPWRSQALLAITERLTNEEAERIFRRLSLTGEPLRRLLAARREGSALATAAARLTAGSPSEWAALLRERSSIEAIGWAWCLSLEPARSKIEWFLAEGERLRPTLSGDDLLSLGVPEGPLVGELLSRLRDAKLDGTVATREDEIALVRAWGKSPETDSREARASRQR